MLIKRDIDAFLSFTNAYPSAETFGVSPDNVFEFLIG